MTTNQRAAMEAAVEKLAGIAEGRGRFSTDNHQHAVNVIEESKAAAGESIALLRAALVEPEWKPISEAPRDRRIELWVPEMPNNKYGDFRANIGKWDEDEFSSRPRPHWNYGCYMGKIAERAYQPTHWRELPAPPEVKP